MPAPLPVVVVHFRAPAWLRATVSSFVASDIPVEVLVVHNGGDLPELPPEVEVVVPESNLGYAGGANVGLRRWLDDGAAPFCVVASHDVRVAPEALRRLVAAAEQDPALGAVGPSLPRYKADAGILEPAYLNGTCVLLRRECIEVVGVFDEDFGSYFEDRDLSRRMVTAGWRLAVVADASATDAGTSSPLIAGPLMFANEVLYAAKHDGPRGSFKRLVMLVPLALRDVVRALLRPADRAIHVHRARSRLAALPKAITRLGRFYTGWGHRSLKDGQNSTNLRHRND